VGLWWLEQRHEESRAAEWEWWPFEEYRYPTLARGGRGPRSKYTGMTWTAARPSDDPAERPFLIPANAFAVVELRHAAELAVALWGEESMARTARRIASTIDAGIQQHGIVRHAKYGRIYAYEVDGMGNSVLMDDANVPSLLSLPYLGYEYDEEVYANTRRFILSEDNPHYSCSLNKRVCGIGSGHVAWAIKDNIWPMSQVMQALTASDVHEKIDLLQQLLQTTAADNTDGGYTGWMHEAYDANDPTRFTRPWFCWVDALFAELVSSLTSIEANATVDSVPTSAAHTIPSYEPAGWFSQLRTGSAGARASLGANGMGMDSGFGAGDDVGHTAYRCGVQAGCMLQKLLDLDNPQGPAFVTTAFVTTGKPAAATAANLSQQPSIRDHDRLRELVLDQDLLKSLRKRYRRPRSRANGGAARVLLDDMEGENDVEGEGSGEDSSEGGGVLWRAWRALALFTFGVPVSSNEADGGRIGGSSRWRLHGKVLPPMESVEL
jgi:hypothetical protein